MSETGTVLEHLLIGREALVVEIQRLTTAIEELDAVIVRVGGSSADSPTGEPATRQAVSAAGASRKTRPSTRAAAPPRSRRSGSAGASRKSPDGTKSIRVHVLEMLGEEQRDYGLAEIIDRIHAAGIKAHDDAVRSITIKLMKNGTVERVGRGQYRLARRAAPEQSTDPASTEQPVPDSYPPALNLGQPW
jgi:predicted alternative tryptophan synthase beta-subunit